MSKLFQESKCFRPFAYPWANDLWKDHEKMHWVEDEIPLGDDVTAWKNNRLKDDEKEFVTQILRMFTQADVNVGQMYYKGLIPKFSNNEVTKMLGGFANREGTHQNAYALLNDTLGLPEGDYAAFLDYKEMADKHEFMLDIDPSTKGGLALSLAKGVFNEGVSLFASFVMLLNFQRRGLMLGMCKIVEWSIKDETKHVEGVSELFRTMCREHPTIVTNKFKTAIYDMARKVVELEDSFIDLAYGQSEVEGLLKDDVKTYIRYITDRRLVQLGLKENFNVSVNPLPWLDWIVSATNHTNFFEGKVAEYEVGGLEGGWEYEDENSYTVYTMNGCKYCAAAKKLLDDEYLVYNEVDLSDYDKRQEFFDDNGFTTGNRLMPKIYRDGELIGGYTELEAELHSIA